MKRHFGAARSRVLLPRRCAAGLVLGVLASACAAPVPPAPGASCLPPVAGSFAPYGRASGEWLLVAQDGAWRLGRLVDPWVLESDPPQLRVSVAGTQATVAVTALREAAPVLGPGYRLEVREADTWRAAHDWALTRDAVLIRRDSGASWEPVAPELVRAVALPAEGAE